MGGLGLAVAGAWALSQTILLVIFLGTNLYFSISVILVTTGILVSVLSMLNMIAAFKEIKCLLMTYILVLILVLAGAFVGIVVAFIFRSQVMSIDNFMNVNQPTYQTR